MPDRIDGFTSMRDELGDVPKEINHSSELRPRLEAEMDRPFRDEECPTFAERTEMRV